MFKQLVVTFWIGSMIFYWLLRPNLLLNAAQENATFMTAPFAGTKTVSVVFDHEYPVYGNEVVPPYNGDNRTIVHNNGKRYESGSICAGYSGHPGVDYVMVYDYVLAAHNGKVVTAGWNSPNHRFWLGLMVEIEYENVNHGRYKTRYGHLSTLMTSVNDNVTQKSVIAISGNTGGRWGLDDLTNIGPHLHFEVQKQYTDNNGRKNFYPVNPYGWEGEYEDPWRAIGRPASTNLWAILPSVSKYSTCGEYMYLPGSPITPISEPPLTPDLTNPVHLVLDDRDIHRFVTSGGPWYMVHCTGLPACYGSSYHFTPQTLTDASATWKPLVHDLVTGMYDVYAYIPFYHANTRLAYYQIHHNNKVHSAGIDQSRFNDYLNYPCSVANPRRCWAYLGRYDFSDGASSSTAPQKIVVYHEGDVGQQVAADAVALVLAEGPPNLTVNIAQESDDAGRHAVGCSFWIEHPEIYLDYCTNGTPIISGFRYSGVQIPNNAIVTRAHLLFQIDGPYDTHMLLRFYGEKHPASPTFSSANKPEDRTSLTNERIIWFVPPSDLWPGSGGKRFSPDLAPVVQEIIDIPGWQQGGRTLTFIVRPDPSLPGTEYRRVMAYERSPGGGTHSARLLVWYTTGNP